MSDIMKTMRISAAGMRTQGVRLRVIAENIANAQSLPTSPGEEHPTRLDGAAVLDYGSAHLHLTKRTLGGQHSRHRSHQFR